MGTGREVLLARVIDDVGRHGLSDRSLRDLARGAGTSHRMLIHHFQSRDGLIRAIVAEMEARQRALLHRLAAQAVTPADLVRGLWREVSAPRLRPFVRLFFEVVARSPTDPAGDLLTAPWIVDTATVADRLGTRPDPVQIRLGVAVLRGLLIDVLATGDTATATAALERFLATLDPAAEAGPAGSPR